MTIIPITIKKIKQATPTIKVLELDLNDQHFEYKAGQWIDCYAEINGERKIVGYSLASSPNQTGTIEVAVKESDNPVTMFVHGAAKEGDTLYIEGGQGDIYYDESKGEKVVLVGAGIGVAPLMGMFRYIDEGEGEVILLQSAPTVNELLYHQEASEKATNNERLTYYSTVTREEPSGNIGSGRINGKTIVDLGLDLTSVFYLSGPGGMIPELEKALLDMGVPSKRILYEVWWKPAH